jgi:hypothetical protein
MQLDNHGIGVSHDEEVQLRTAMITFCKRTLDGSETANGEELAILPRILEILLQ